MQNRYIYHVHITPKGFYLAVMFLCTVITAIVFFLKEQERILALCPLTLFLIALWGLLFKEYHVRSEFDWDENSISLHMGRFNTLSRKEVYRTGDILSIEWNETYLTINYKNQPGIVYDILRLTHNKSNTPQEIVQELGKAFHVPDVKITFVENPTI